MSLWLLLLLLLVVVVMAAVVVVQAGEGRDGWGVLWAQQLLLLQAGPAALALLLLRAQASCARLAGKAQATDSSMVRLV